MVGAAVAALVFNGAFDSYQSDGASDFRQPRPAGAPASGASAVDAPDVAVILPQAPQPATSVESQAAAAMRDDPMTALGALSAAGAVSQQESPVKPVDALPRAASPARHRAASRARTSSSNEDSDVALLAALIQHIQHGGPGAWAKTQELAPGADPVEIDMRACPAANTRAGIACRRRICKEHQGRSPACPAPASRTDDD